MTLAWIGTTREKFMQMSSAEYVFVDGVLHLTFYLFICLLYPHFLSSSCYYLFLCFCVLLKFLLFYIPNPLLRFIYFPHLSSRLLITEAPLRPSLPLPMHPSRSSNRSFVQLITCGSRVNARTTFFHKLLDS